MDLNTVFMLMIPRFTPPIQTFLLSSTHIQLDIIILLHLYVSQASHTWYEWKGTRDFPSQIWFHPRSLTLLSVNGTTLHIVTQARILMDIIHSCFPFTSNIKSTSKSCSFHLWVLPSVHYCFIHWHHLSLSHCCLPLGWRHPFVPLSQPFST